MRTLIFLVTSMWLLGCAGSAAVTDSGEFPALPQLDTLESGTEPMPREQSAVFLTEIPWSFYYLKSDNAVIPPGENVLQLQAGPGELAWVIYRFYVDLSHGEAKLSFDYSADAQGSVYLALSDYSQNRWQFHEVAFDAPPSGQVELVIPDGADLPNGMWFYAAIMTWDGVVISFDTVRLQNTVQRTTPENLTASDGTHLDYIHIEWDSVTYADGYYLEYKRSTDPETAWELVIENPIASTIYNHYGFGPSGEDPEYNVPYDYRVQTHYIDDDVSDYSNVDSGFRRTPPPQSVEATSNIIIDKVEVTWESALGIPSADYKIYRKHHGADEYTFIGQTPETTWMDTVIPDTDYYDYAIETLGPDGPSLLSAPARGSALTFEITTCRSLDIAPSDVRLISDQEHLLGAYFSPKDSDLIVTQPLAMPPTGADDWRHFDLEQAEGEGTIALGLLDGRPALAFNVPDQLLFAWCNEALPLDSPVWTAMVLEDSTSNLQYYRPSWIESGGKPVVASRIDREISMWFYFSQLAEPKDGGDWLKHGLGFFSTGTVLSMQLVQNKPAVAFHYGDVPNIDLAYAAADITEPSGATDWTIHGIIPTGTGYIRSSAEMLLNKDFPLVAYSRYPSSDPDKKRIEIYRSISHAPSQDADWLPAGQLLEPGLSYGTSMDLEIVNGRPGICFYEENNQRLLIAMSGDSQPDESSWYIGDVTGTTGVGQACALAEYQALPVLLYYDANAEEIRFALGR